MSTQKSFDLSKKICFPFLLTLLFMAVSCGNENSENANEEEAEIEMTELPENARLLFENDYLKVVTMRLQSGENLPDLGNSDYVIYQPMTVEEIYAGDTLQVDSAREDMKDYTAPNYNAEVIEDTIETMNWAAGEMYLPGEFNGNDTNTEANYLLIWNMNNNAGGTSDEMSTETTKADTGNTKKLYEMLGSAKGLTLEEVFIPEGDTLKREEASPRALFFLTTHTYHYVSPDQSRRNVSNERGQIEWHETKRGYLINSGPTPVQILVIKPSGAVATMQ